MEELKSPYYPYEEPPLVFMIIDSGGVPVYIYPPQRDKNKETMEKTILFSGLLTAINNFAKEIGGTQISNLTFGKYHIFISRGTGNTLIVSLFNREYIEDMDKCQSVHIEALSMLDIYLQQNTRINEAALNITIEPFYKSVIKTCIAKKR